jgi:translation initiation factor 6
MDILGSPNIGIYALTTNFFTILPVKVSREKAEKLSKCLKGNVAYTSIGSTNLIGVLATGNSNGIVLPHFVSDKEIKVIKSVWKGNIGKIKSKITALGNLILANDNGAIIGESLMKDKKAVIKIMDTLGVEAVSSKIAELPYVGSLAIATNRGILAHPLLKDKEQKILKEVLKVPVDIGTINNGVPFVPSGLLANDYGVVIGSFTTGPEILMISNIIHV